MTDGVPAETATPTCEVCGRGPAAWIYASMYSGRVLFGDELFWKGNACKQCATCQYRAGLAHCLWAGWWSPVALVVNPRMIFRNAKGLRSARAMPEPQGRALAEPLDAGKPVLARPAALLGLAVPVLVVVAIIALVVALTGSGRLDELHAGDCVDLPNGTVFDRVDPVGCDGPHDAEVSGVVTGSTPRSQDLCVKESIAYLGIDGPIAGLSPAALRFTNGDGVVCLVTSNDGKPLRGSHRGVGR